MIYGANWLSLTERFYRIKKLFIMPAERERQKDFKAYLEIYV